MSRSCQSATSSSAALAYDAQQAREPAQVLGQDRVLLVRHRRRALLPLAERLRRLADLGALPVADGERQPLDRGAEARQRHEVARRGGRARRSASGPISRRRPSDASAACLDRRDRGWRRCRRRRRSCRPRSPRARDTSAACARPSSAYQPANTRPAVIGSAWMPCERPIAERRAVLLARGGGRRRAAGRRPPGSGRPPRPAGSRATRRARPTTSSPGAASAPARPPAPRRGSGTRSRRGAVRSSCSRMRAGIELAGRLRRARRPPSRPGPSPPPPSRRRRPARRAARSRSGGCRTTARPARRACSGGSSSAPVLTKTRRWFKDAFRE